MLRYCSIDIETSGLDPATCQVLEIAAVCETDWITPVDQLPSFSCFVEHPVYRGQAFAINMNARIFAELAKPAGDRSQKTYYASSAIDALNRFCREHLGSQRWTIAGNNVATFDLQFLDLMPEWNPKNWRHRVIDPGSMWMLPTDDKIPDTAEMHEASRCHER